MRVGLSDWLWRRLTRLWGLDKYDAETAEILAVGCMRAEEEAALRYGPDWRAKFAEYRRAERKRIWGPWHFILPEQNS